MRNQCGGKVKIGQDYWRLSVDAGYSDDGRRRRKSKRFHGTSKEADSMLAVMMLDANKASPVSSSMSVRDFFTEVYLPDMQKLRDKDMLAPSTYNGYESAVRIHIAPSPFGDMPLEALTVREIKQHFMSISKPGAAEKGWRAFRQGINYAVDDCELLDTNPLPKRIRLPEKEAYEAEILTKDEIQQLVGAFRGHPLEAWVLVSVGTGARRGETCALWWQDIDLTTGEVTITKSLQYVSGEVIERKKTKTPKSKRTLVLPRSITSRLVEIAGSNMKVGPLCPDRDNPTIRENPNMAASDYKKHCKKMGIKHVPPSNLRNTFATLMMLDGADGMTISSVLGHSSLKMDYEHYIGAQTEQSRLLADRMDRTIAG